MYEKYLKLLKDRGVTTYQVCKETGIPESTISMWKARKDDGGICDMAVPHGSTGSREQFKKLQTLYRNSTALKRFTDHTACGGCHTFDRPDDLERNPDAGGRG